MNNNCLILLQYLVPFVLNQSGSLLYIYALQFNSLSVSVLLANSIALLATSVTSLMVEKINIGMRTYVGAILITIGTSICVISQKNE